MRVKSTLYSVIHLDLDNLILVLFRRAGYLLLSSYLALTLGSIM